jgi:hypothetical protein
LDEIAYLVPTDGDIAIAQWGGQRHVLPCGCPKLQLAMPSQCLPRWELYNAFTLLRRPTRAFKCQWQEGWQFAKAKGLLFLSRDQG